MSTVTLQKVIGAGTLTVLNYCLDAFAKSLRVGGGATNLTPSSEDMFSFGSDILTWEFIAHRDGAVSTAHGAFAGKRLGGIAKK